MSLQLAAKHLAAQGRGSDKQLVHMSPREVKSLQGLAMAHGGSLTINPQTGLPEAGFLSSILPMVAGAALMATGVGAPMAAMMVGGGMTAATGSLEKGIMAGLGAYGGAGLAGGLMSAGSAGADVAANAANMESMGSALAQDQAAAAAAGTNAGANTAANAAAIESMGGVAGGVPAQGFGGIQATPSTQTAFTPVASVAPTAQAGVAPTTSSSSTLGEGFSKMGQGIEALGTSQGQDAFMKSIGGAKGLMQTGVAAAVPMMAPEEPEPYVSDSTRINYRFDPNRVENPEAGYSGAPTGQRRYFNQTYTRLADGGITSMADGGYSYNPDTQTYSGSAPSGGVGGGISGLLGRALAGSNAGRVSYSYDPASQTYTQLGDSRAESGEPIMIGLDTGAGYGGDGMGGYDGGDGGAQGGPGGGMSGADGIGGGEAGGGFGGGDGGGGEARGGLMPSRKYHMARGGLSQLGDYSDGGGPVEAMSNANALGASTGYPMADIQRNAYAVPYQQPMSQNVVTGSQDVGVDAFTGEERFAKGGISHLGDYSDGGRLLRGPGDGVSDSIPAMIGAKQPARLADGEFVVPARIVSELGNGSTEAGARKLYAMMDRVQRARGKTTGKGRIAKNTRADKYLPA